MYEESRKISYQYMTLQDQKKKKFNSTVEDEERSCLCFSRNGNQSIAERRKMTSKRLFEEYKNQEQQDTIYNSTNVLITLYLSDQEDRERIYQMFQRCRLNPNLDPTVKQRNDLEYYIPQLINYLVFHEEMGNQYLINFLNQASQVDFFFAHQVYFQLNSVSAIVLQNEEIQLEAVQEYLKDFVDMMSLTYLSTILIAQRLLVEQIKYRQKSNYSQKNSIITQTVTKGFDKKNGLQKMSNNSLIQYYGTNYYDQQAQEVAGEGLHLKNYRSIHQYPFEEEIITNLDNSFTSTIEFWEDLVAISEKLHLAQPKIISLKADLQKINARLPAAVYVPFLANSIRNYVILNIVFQESKVFSTKERAPFYICLEVFRPDEDKEEEKDQFTTIQFDSNDKRLSDPRTLKTEMSKLHDVSLNLSQSESNENPSNIKKNIRLTLKNIGKSKTHQDKLEPIEEDYACDQSKEHSIRTSTEEGPEEQQSIGMFYQKQDNAHPKSDTLYQSFNLMNEESEKFGSLRDASRKLSNREDEAHNYPPLSDLRGSISQDLDQLELLQNQRISLTVVERQELSTQLFGETEQQQKDRIRKLSPFRNFKTWDLVHLIVKTGDNLKQEQFAMQLISQFNQIFQLEDLPMKLTTYDVLSTGPSCGLIQMVKDATTMDSLKKNIFEKHKYIKSMKDFFQYTYNVQPSLFYDQNIREASSNFLYSLVGYSLVCYFLQLKDRHNGNILLHRDGYMIHIDFGFLLSNAPGKGISLERNVPFKLLTEYVEILGGVDSQLFDRFRMLFYKGFQAIRKHKDKILLLVKMMYSGHGTTLPCFKKGNQTISNLESRFYPDVTSEAELNVICQDLINQSINNWRARWYDKYQYFFQGIFY